MSMARETVLYNDDGSPTAHSILAADTAGGIRVPKPVSYSVGDNTEYVLLRNYQITIEADVLTLDSEIKNFVESVSFTGGARPATPFATIRR
jgi:hypothetical protein